jgi:hypothetical protein
MKSDAKDAGHYIKSLIKLGENEHLDFKFEISDAKKIARTFSAFANTDGGDLVFGIAEVDGSAGDLVGLKNLNPDDAIGKIEVLPRETRFEVARAVAARFEKAARRPDPRMPEARIERLAGRPHAPAPDRRRKG